MLSGFRTATGLARRHGGTVSAVTSSARSLSVHSRKFLFHGSLFLVVKLTVLVGVKFCQHTLFKLGLAGFVSSLDGFFFLVVNLAVFVRVELLHESGTIMGTMRMMGTGMLRCRGRGCSSIRGRCRFLSQQGQGR